MRAALRLNWLLQCPDGTLETLSPSPIESRIAEGDWFVDTVGLRFAHTTMEKDPLVEKFDQEVYATIPFRAEPGRCRPQTAGGMLICGNKVVRNDRCILHMPKLSERELSQLSPTDVDRERQLDEEFKATLLSYLQQQPGSALDIANIHLIDVAWNQSPWVDILRSKQHVDFSGAVFHRMANLSNVPLGQESRFTKCVFRAPLSFNISVLRRAVFHEAVFEDEASFNGVTFIDFCNFAGARFLGPVDFTWAKIDGRLWFRGGNEGNIVFYGPTNMQRLELKPGADLTIESACVEKLSLLYTDAERITLRNVEWSATAPFRFGARRRRRFWDEQGIDKSSVAPDRLEAIATAYRQMVIASEKRREFEAAEDFHYGEMEMRRLLIAHRYARWMRPVARNLSGIGLYRILSGYGGSYLRALVALLLFILSLPVAFLFTGLRENPTGSSKQPELIQYRFAINPDEKAAAPGEFVRDYGHALVHTLSILTFQRDRQYRPATTTSQSVEAVASFILAGQAALLLLAVRRAFKR